MHLSRSIAAAAAACVLAATMPQLAQAREIVGFSGSYSSGTVVVKTTERALYYVLGNGKAVRYPVGVGRVGKQWTARRTSPASNYASLSGQLGNDGGRDPLIAAFGKLGGHESGRASDAH